MEINNNMGTGFKRGSKYRPIITVGNNKQSKIVFVGTKKQHQQWLDEAKFKKGTIHHVYTDRGGNNVSYFRATKK
jgi:hypothetical protein